MKAWMVAGPLILLVGSNAAWLYLSIDRGSAEVDRSAEVRVEHEAAELLASLILRLPRDAGLEESYRTLQDEYPNEVVKLRGDTIEIGNVILVFRDDSLVAAALM